uniref:MFS domain-containing protein n=1 Tax=Caenorhabditis japonica TaxID=281687 RepID=A0A8R1HWR8_CAEJA
MRCVGHDQMDLEISGTKQKRRMTGTRFMILFIGLICITFTNANMILMNFTVICMDDVIVSQKGNSTALHWLERPSDVSLTFSAAAIGAILGTVPAVTLITRYGTRKVLTVYGLLSSVGTLAMPLAVQNGLMSVLIARLLQGIGASVLYSAIGTISEAWSPISEIGLFVAFLSSAFQLSNIATMPTAGVLCESSLGWKSIFYLFGAISSALYLIFYLYYRDTPEKHKHIDKQELSKIRDGKVSSSSLGNKGNAKFSEIFRNWEVLEITVAVLGLNIRETGYSNAIPYFFAAIVKFAAGPATDRMAHIPERIRLILFALVPQLCMAAGFLTMSFTSNVLIAQIAYTISVVLAGLNVIGMVKCAQIVAKEHLSLIMAVISMSSWIAAFILPIVIGLLCPNNSHTEWSLFYLFVAIFVVLSNIPFPFLARVKGGPQRVGEMIKF